MTTSNLVAAACALSMFVYAFDKSILYWLWLVSDGSSFGGYTSSIANGVRQGQLWRLVTWPMLNPPDLNAVLSILIIWWLGRELERTLGRVKYLWFVGILVVTPAVIYVLVVPTLIAPVAAIISGASYLASGIVFAFLVTHPEARSFFNVPFWIIAVVFEAISLLQLLGDRIWDGLLFFVVMLVVGVLEARAFGLSEMTQIPKLPLPQFITKDPYQKSNRAREKAKRRGRGSGPTVVPIRGTGHLDRASQADMDMLLDKINASGIDSLTLAERRRLDEHSRRLRGS